ncbi:hypothetical protein T4E_8456 [Trichinella pseudospiralis]|uniref:Uncharacterized protein n=1 Tax=Trichinella pseudospiralis TaxID=6337 RepID=A0A0V0YCM6_TRIPS|nr:hypothetical protein T4E_8456 [Trichinella pseudospiralis]
MVITKPKELLLLQSPSLAFGPLQYAENRTPLENKSSVCCFLLVCFFLGQQNRFRPVLSRYCHNDNFTARQTDRQTN